MDVPCFGVLIIWILLFRVLFILGSPIFGNSHIESKVQQISPKVESSSNPSRNPYIFLDPKEPIFFRVPYYDFFIGVLKKVGYLGLRFTETHMFES